MSDIKLGSIYDLNRQVMGESKPLDPIALNSCVKELSEWMISQEDTYFMLLNKENSYFTVFQMPQKRPKKLITELKEVLEPIGAILSIEKESVSGAYEIWIKVIEEELPYVFYLFPYDRGMVIVE